MRRDGRKWRSAASGAIAAAAVLHWGAPAAFGADAAAFRLPRTGDAFFIEDDLVYKRLLRFERGGRYAEIDQDRWTSAETDRGTWEQDAKGLLLLHPVCQALRFRALFGGPLTLVLDRPGALDALPLLADAIRSFLSRSGDDVFASARVAEMAVRPPGFDSSIRLLSADPRVETFARGNLESLLRQVNDLLWSVRTNTYILQPVKTAGCSLLILQDAVFQAPDLAALHQERHLRPGQPPPFCFVRVDSRTFASTAGNYLPFHLPASH